MMIDFANSEWEASTMPDGSVMVTFKEGQTYVVKNDPEEESS